jgi:isoleucyl-tRNA synthetase
MYEIFLGLSKILAPFIPFITEEIYQNLKLDSMPESIHLCNYPECDKKQIDKQLEEGMEKIRILVEAGRSLRSKIGIKVRYPLSSATIVSEKKVWDLIKDLLDLLNEEINVKAISHEKDTSKFMIKSIKPNHSIIGPKYKEKAKKIVSTIETMDKEKLFVNLKQKKEVTINIDEEEILLTMNDFEVIESEKQEIARTEVEGIILFLDTALSPELKAEGFAREIVRRIQSMRKELDLDVEDKIVTQIKLDAEKKKALQSWEIYIKNETRSKEISFTDKPAGKLVKKWKIDELVAEIGIAK